jgi:surface-anchored protein
LHQKFRVKFFRRLLPLTGILSASALTPPTDLIYGHYEMHVDYTVTPGNPDAGWSFWVSYNLNDDFNSASGVVRLDPESTVILASPRTRTAVPSPAGLFSRFGPPGTPLWILPQNNVLGTCFLGVRTIVPTGTFQARVGNNYTVNGQGSIALRLVSMTGTGPAAGGQFATWKTEAFGGVVFSFDSTDGITGADEIPTVPIGSHTHYNWGLTKPGIYHLTFEAKGKLMPAHGSAITSAQQTFTFAVPFSGRIGNGGALLLSGVEAGAPRVLTADPASGVAYAPDQAMIEATTPAGPASSGLPGALWQWSGNLRALPLSTPNGVGVAPATASGGLVPAEWSNVELEIAAVRGPGGFALLDGGGTVLADGPGDVVALTATSDLPVTAAFTATGLHRVTVIPRGTRNGQPVVGAPVMVTFGAGLTAEHDYAAWQASFEQTAGLPAGSLADHNADFDRDGISNGFEFAFFWQGMDPTVSDAAKMPRAFPSAAGDGVFGFLRDSYKDPLDESKWQLRPAASTDLLAWKLRSSRIPGFPLEVFETGLGEGNAYGRIARNQLRIEGPQVGRAFFRFDLAPPP